MSPGLVYILQIIFPQSHTGHQRTLQVLVTGVPSLFIQRQMLWERTHIHRCFRIYHKHCCIRSQHSLFGGI